MCVAAIALMAPQMLAARGPEPLALKPVAGLTPVTVHDLIPEIKSRLHSLAVRSPYGEWNAAGRDHVRAWLWSYAGRAAVRLYPLTHDKQLISGLLAAWRRYDEAGHDFAAVDGYGWYTSERDSGMRYREVPIAGLIIRPIVELLLEARRSPELAKLIEPDQYRGKKVKSLRDKYVFGDYSRNFVASDGRILYLDTGNVVTEVQYATGSKLGMSVLGFAEDARGELYVMGKTGARPGNTGITDPTNTSGVVKRIIAK